MLIVIIILFLQLILLWLLEQTLSNCIPKWLRGTKLVKGMNRFLVNHLGLALTKEDMQSVVDLMEPYGQISNGIELLSPPLDVCNYH